MFGLGFTELVIILVIILIIFGAGKLPGIGSGLGKGIHNFKEAISDNKGRNQTGLPEELANQKEEPTA